MTDDENSSDHDSDHESSVDGGPVAVLVVGPAKVPTSKRCLGNFLGKKQKVKTNVDKTSSTKYRPRKKKKGTSNKRHGQVAGTSKNEEKDHDEDEDKDEDDFDDNADDDDDGVEQYSQVLLSQWIQ
jgi:Sec-independent protein translocase protein TatA